MEEASITITDFLDLASLEFYPVPGQTFYYIMLGVDPALGIGGDYTAIQGINMKDGTQVLEWRSNALVPKAVVKNILVPICKHESFKTVEVVIESNAMGHEFISRYQDLVEEGISDMPPLYYTTKEKSEKITYGLETNSALKSLMIAEMRDLFRVNPDVVRSHRLLNELLNLQIAKGGKIDTKVRKNKTDDLIMSYALALRGRMDYLLTRADPDFLKELQIEISGKTEFPKPPLPEVIRSSDPESPLPKAIQNILERDKKWEEFYRRLGLK